MSRPRKNTQMTPTPETSSSNVVKFVVKKKVFDFDKFERKTVENKGEFTPAADLAVALQRCKEETEEKDVDGKKVTVVVKTASDVLLKHANAGLLKAAKSDAKAGISTEGGSAKTVNTFVNSFRLMPMFSTIKERTEQTKAIYAWIQSMPQMLEQIKSAAIEALKTENDEDDDDETDGEKVTA